MKEKCRIVVLISGRGSNLRALIECSKNPGTPYQIVAVVSDKAKAAGLDLAIKENIPTVHVPRLPAKRTVAEFNSALADAVSNHRPDFIVLAGFMRILGKTFIDRFPEQILNIHPSLLPSFPGLHVQQQAIDAGVRFSGCTVHFVVEEVDAGPIVAQAVVPVLPGDDADALSARILKREHQIYPMVINGLAREQIRLVHGKKGTQVQFSDEILPSSKDSFFLSLQERIIN
jgi:phosphoribosylglycinamide formyltransferase-1